MDEMGGHMRFYEKMFFGSCLPWENYKKLSSMAVFGHNYLLLGISPWNFTWKFRMDAYKSVQKENSIQSHKKFFFLNL